MPNHVTTRCTVLGPREVVESFAKRMIVEQTDEYRPDPYQSFDFEQIIPMPEVARDVGSNLGTPDILAILIGASSIAQLWSNLRGGYAGEFLGPWQGLFNYREGEIQDRLEAAFPGCVEEARKMARCFGETGYTGWYEWSRANWGTKWNAYSFELLSDDPLRFSFDTAWGFPFPVFEKLAQEYPDLHFHCITFDEGWNFGGEGWFNPPEEEHAFSVSKDQATDELYERVYGEKPPRDEDEDDEE